MRLEKVRSFTRMSSWSFISWCDILCLWSVNIAVRWLKTFSTSIELCYCWYLCSYNRIYIQDISILLWSSVKHYHNLQDLSTTYLCKQTQKMFWTLCREIQWYLYFQFVNSFLCTFLLLIHSTVEDLYKLSICFLLHSTKSGNSALSNSFIITVFILIYIQIYVSSFSWFRERNAVSVSVSRKWREKVLFSQLLARLQISINLLSQTLETATKLGQEVTYTNNNLTEIANCTSCSSRMYQRSLALCCTIFKFSYKSSMVWARIALLRCFTKLVILGKLYIWTFKTVAAVLKWTFLNALKI